MDAIIEFEQADDDLDVPVMGEKMLIIKSAPIMYPPCGDETCEGCSGTENLFAPLRAREV